jgi:hypothetical protein
MHHSIHSSNSILYSFPIANTAADELEIRTGPDSEQRFASMLEDIQHSDPVSTGKEHRNQGRSDIARAACDYYIHCAFLEVLPQTQSVVAAVVVNFARRFNDDVNRISTR